MLLTNLEIPDIVNRYKVVAVVGASKNPEKDAHTVPAYLVAHGFTVIPVNPTADTVLGIKAYPTLSALPDELAKMIDIVDVFRPSEELADIASQTAEMKRKTGRPFVFWAQLGIKSEAARDILTRAAVGYVMDYCIRTAHQEYGKA
ncbi:MAG: CoA-binding protein [Thaumarchaeota archaeon]|nr:CoA-binding protein [Nitrososphaerota archaeon]